MAHKKKSNYRFPANATHHVVELYRGPNDSSTEMVQRMEEQARISGNTVRAVSNGFELIACSTPYPSVTARRLD